jgi:hypothetical protein
MQEQQAQQVPALVLVRLELLQPEPQLVQAQVLELVQVQEPERLQLQEHPRQLQERQRSTS